MTKAEALQRVKELEQQWLNADAVAFEMLEVARAAQARHQHGNDAAASILVDAAVRIGQTYEQCD